MYKNSSFNQRISLILNAFHNSDDIFLHDLIVDEQRLTLVYLDSMAKKEEIQREIILRFSSPNNNVHQVLRNLQAVTTLEEQINALLLGNCLLFLQDVEECFLFNASESKSRAITEPTSEKILRGAHEGFVEDLATNIHLIRKLIFNPNLVVKYFRIEQGNKRRFAMLYMKDIVNETILQEVESRMAKIDFDTIDAGGMTAQFLEDYPYSPFPTILMTERSDRIHANLMEGRICIITEGSPGSLLLPVNFFTFFHASGDYNQKWMLATFGRILTMLGCFIGLFLPAFYIAVIAFHFEVLPRDLVLPVKTAIQTIPYPPLIEAAFMEITIQLLELAAFRLASPIAQTIGVVGGLVIGDAVVASGLVSNIMIIVVAFTAISSYTIPSPEMLTAIRYFRFPTMILAACFGFLGIVVAAMFLMIHLCKLEPFGRSYLAPVSPFRLRDMKDTIIRLPLRLFRTRPEDVLPKKYARKSIGRK